MLKSSELKELIAKLSIVIIIVTALATFLGMLGRYHWLLDLLSHFRVQYLTILVGLSLLLLLMRHNLRWVIFGIIGLIVNLTYIIPYFSIAQNADKPYDLKIAAINVLSVNNQKNLVREFIDKEDPDIFLLQEFTDEWEEDLTALLNNYEFHHVINRNDNFGIALVSKLKPEQFEVVNLSESSVPSIFARFSYKGKRFTFIGTHPVPPSTSKRAQDRNQQLQEIAKLKLDFGDKYILAGDLNITPYSPNFTDFLQNTNTVEARDNFGINPSWPACCWWLQIPIDHILVSPTIEVVGFYTGSYTGSDHLPVVALVKL